MFLPRDALSFAKRDIAIACRPSVCAPVCLSVTFVNCGRIGWKSSKVIANKNNFNYILNKLFLLSVVTNLRKVRLIFSLALRHASPHFTGRKSNSSNILRNWHTERHTYQQSLAESRS